MKIANATIEILDANKLKLVEYLSLPKAMRPMSLKAFAGQILGVSEPTIHAWKKETAVVMSVRKTIENRFADDIPDVLLALKNNAIAGNPRAARLFLEYVDPGYNQETVPPPKEYTKQEVDEIIKNLEKKFYPNGQKTT